MSSTDVFVSDGVPYGFLIDLYEKSTCATILVKMMKEQYPHIYIGRADRFLKTVQRIAAPCTSSVLGKITLTGDDLQKYRENVWIPRIRNKSKYNR